MERTSYSATVEFLKVHLLLSIVMRNPKRKVLVNNHNTDITVLMAQLAYYIKFSFTNFSSNSTESSFRVQIFFKQ